MGFLGAKTTLGWEPILGATSIEKNPKISAFG